MTEDLRDVERELMLLTRHQIQPTAARRRRCRTLDRSAYLLLSRIEVEGPMTIGQLAEAFALDVSTVNRQTAAMLAADLVSRIPDPDGGLARKLSITEEGTRRLHADRDLILEELGHLLGGWSVEELRDFATMLGRFNASIEMKDSDGNPWPRPTRVPGH